MEYEILTQDAGTVTTDPLTQSSYVNTELPLRGAPNRRPVWYQMTLRGLDAEQDFYIVFEPTGKSDIGVWRLLDGIATPLTAIKKTNDGIDLLSSRIGAIYQLPKASSLQLRMSLATNQSLKFTPALMTRQALYAKDHAIGWLYVSSLSIMLALLIVNGVFFIVLRDRFYFYYFAYFSTLLLFLIGDIELFRELFGAHTWLHDLLRRVNMLIAAFFVMTFNLHFCALDRHAPRLARFIRLSRWLPLLILPFVLRPTEALHATVATIFNLYVAVGIPAMIVATAIAMREGSRAAWFFMGGWILIFIATFGRTLFALGVLRDSSIWFYAIAPAAALESIVISIGLADRVLQFRSQRDLAELRQAQTMSALQREQVRAEFAEQLRGLGEQNVPEEIPWIFARKLMSAAAQIVPMRSAAMWIHLADGRETLLEHGDLENALPALARAHEGTLRALARGSKSLTLTLGNVTNTEPMGALLVAAIPVEMEKPGFAILLAARLPSQIFENDEIALLHQLGKSFSQSLGEAWQAQQLRFDAERDALTKLYNRGFIERAMQSRFSALRQKPEAAAVLFADIDHFKSINDRYGHAAGDIVLRVVAERMHKSMPRQSQIGRFGGEEFVAIVRADPRAALAIAQSTLRAVNAEPIVTNAGALDVTISIGVSSFSPRDSSADDVLARADGALYVAKNEGRNCVRVRDDPSPLAIRLQRS
jgi:diguanylate cyclase (GGDEF)-like protein